MPNIELGAGGREQLPLTVYVWVVVFFEEPGLRHVTKSHRLDTSGRSEDKEAAAIAPIVRKACDMPCSTTCNTHATHMQHDMQHDTQHTGKVEKTQGFFFFGHFATRPAFKTFLLL